MGLACSRKKLIAEHEYEMPKSYTWNQSDHSTNRPDHGNITGSSKRIFFHPEDQCTSVFEVCSLQRACTSTRVDGSDKLQRIRNPLRIRGESFPEARSNFCETFHVRQYDASFEKAATVSSSQRKSSPLQNEDDLVFCGCNNSSQFISDSELWTTPRIIFSDDSHKLQLKNVLPLADIVTPRSYYSSYSTNVTSATYIPTPITEVIPGKLYLGSEDNAFNEQRLLELGITHILSVTNRINRIHGIEYEHFVMNDMGRTELKTVLERVYPFMELSQKAEKTLFIHCTLGQNRSPTVVISFLMKKKGLTLYEAHKKLKKQRPLIQIHHKYAKMLLRLERELYGETSLPDD